MMFGSSALAAMTYGATTATSDGNYTLDGVAASVFSLGPSVTTGSFAMGAGLTTGNLTLGGTSMAAGATTIYGGTGTGAITLTPGTSGTIQIGSAGSGAVTITPATTVTGLLTTTAGITSGSNIKSDTTSTDSLGLTGTRWASTFSDNFTGNTIALDGATGVNTLTITDAVADGLSIIRGSTDVIVINTSTPSVTITPATTVTGLLTTTAGITSGSNIKSDTTSTDSLGLTGTRWASTFSDNFTGNTIALDGATGVNTLTITDAVADGLSIIRGSTDVIVINTTTPSVTITPATIVTGALSANGGLDRSAAATLAIGGTNANAVDISKTGVATTIKGTFNVDEAATFDSTLKIGTLSSTVPGSGMAVSAATPRAVDINVDDNDTAPADTAVLLSAGRYRLMRYANSVEEDYAVHGLTKYSALTKSRWGAGVMGAVETTGAVTASDLISGVLGRFGTAATLTLTGANDRVAAVTAFNNNSVALAGSGKSVGLFVRETDVGTPIDLDYGLEIQNSAATTGIKVGTTTTGIDVGVATTGLNFSGAQTNNIIIATAPTGTAGSILKAGTSSTPLSTATANTNFIQVYTKSTATDAGSDTRGIYDRLYLGGATTGGGEALRAFTTIDDAVVGTAHGAHLSLNFDSTANSAQLTGLGVAGRNTLHIPNDATWTSGTLAAVQAEIWSDGSNSDPDGVTELSFIRVVNGGDTTGDDDVDTDAFLMSLQGFADGAGNVFKASAPTTLGASLRIKVGNTTYYLPLYTTQ